MKTTLAVLLNFLLILAAASPLLAKGKTVKITIKGADLKVPIEIADPKILENFQVWTGPRTSGAQRPSLIVDWPQGPLTKLVTPTLYISPSILWKLTLRSEIIGHCTSSVRPSSCN